MPFDVSGSDSEKIDLSILIVLTLLYLSFFFCKCNRFFFMYYMKSRTASKIMVANTWCTTIEVG